MDYKRVVIETLGNKSKWLSHERVATRLANQSVSHVKLRDGILYFDFDGRTHRYNVHESKHEPWVGTWSWIKPSITYDDDVKRKKDLLCLLVHEGVERYVAVTYKLERDCIAHYVAQNVERRFARSIGQNWEEYMLRTEMIYRKENPSGR